MKLKSEERQKRIEEAVISIVNESGLASVKMIDVAKRAKVAQGNVYTYFSTKEELINKTFVACKARSMDYLSVKDMQDLPYVVAFKKAWMRYCTFLINYDAEMYFMEQCIRSSFLTEESKKMSFTFMEEVSVFFQRGIEEQFLKDYKIELILAVFSGFGKELAAMLKGSKIDNMQDLLDSSFEMCWHSVRR